MKKLFVLIFASLFVLLESPSRAEDTTNVDLEAYFLYLKYVDSVNQALEFKTGEVVIGNDLATIQVPEGFKFLNPEQSNFVLSDLWGNPPSECLGMLFPDSIMPLDDNFTYAVEITYAEDGYVEDDDAEDIDYSDLLKEMQKEIKTENETRKMQGYATYDLVGWAQEPYYDSQNKKLHWAKEIKFEDSEINTLNYNFRVLGRKGYLVLNAIGNIDILPIVNKDSEKILASISFNEGHQYSDFNPKLDKVAAYGIGGLVAGKVLAKTGLFAILVKFGKFIFIVIAGVVAALRKKIFGGGSGESA